MEDELSMSQIGLKKHYDELQVKRSPIKQVAVPCTDIEKLEEARLLLHKEYEGCDIDTLIKLTRITEIMWKITHRKYPVVSGDLL